MWTYEIPTGGLWDPNLQYVGFGYSGNGTSKNNLFAQSLRDHGPIPEGDYTIGDPIDSPTHGPEAMPLAPAATNEMFGRAGFMIHGDSLAHPGGASNGCIILPKDYREAIAQSGDRRLRVVGRMPDDV